MAKELGPQGGQDFVAPDDSQRVEDADQARIKAKKGDYWRTLAASSREVTRRSAQARGLNQSAIKHLVANNPDANNMDREAELHEAN